MINTKTVHTFEGGHSMSLKDNVEKHNTFHMGLNGCLYSENGVISYEFRKGTKMVYRNEQIVKYLGHYSFGDVVILMAKCLKPSNTSESEETVIDRYLGTESFEVSISPSDGDTIQFSNEISTNTILIENSHTVYRGPEDETDFGSNYVCDINGEEQINYLDYYKVNMDVPNLMGCSIDQNSIPIHNQDYYDCFIKLTPQGNGLFFGETIWIGMQNWPMNGKISTEGVEENSFYKRVYYTDALNPRRVINIKDTSLYYRNSQEFNQVLNNILLQPEIISLESGGNLNSMKVHYVYRIVSENGQVSEFSPSSSFVTVLVEDQAVRFRGGRTSEPTGKMVRLKCNIVNPEPSSEIECLALEYEAQGIPTSIRNLGRKSSSNVVYFEHYGTEPEFSDNISFGDIVDAKNTWKYCNDFSSVKNKLIAAGLRNDPLPTHIENLEYLFPLHGWDENGQTHECIMNPKPWEFRYIDVSNTQKKYYIKKKVYRSIASFGPSLIKLENVITGESVEMLFGDLSIESYTDITHAIFLWLDQISSTPEFASIFPNLKIEEHSQQILMVPINENIQTEMEDFIFTSNNPQFIQKFDNDFHFLNVPVDRSQFVHGGESLGFHQGTGIRVSFRGIWVPLLKKANSEEYIGNDKVLDYHTPDMMQKFFMKEELYRLAFQAYDNDSTRYFSIPLGDIMIPKLGDARREIDDNGNLSIIGEWYVNQKVMNNVLYGQGIQMHIEVRLSCELKKYIPMYQILYVERTEQNRTILCQGISAPLNRLQDSFNSKWNMPKDVKNKWNMPFFGPVYEKLGFDQYDENGEDYNFDGNEITDFKERVITSRKLMYFDSPDLYFNKISDKKISNCDLQIKARLNPDHPNPVNSLEGDGQDRIPSFSRKIREAYIEGNHTEGLPQMASEDADPKETYEEFFINVSVYSMYSPLNYQHKIEKAATLLRGEIMSGAAFNIVNDVSNNTFGLPNPTWYYGSFQRRQEMANNDDPKSSIFDAAMVSPGYQTVVIKTTEDLFTPSFIGPRQHGVYSRIRLGDSEAPYIVYDSIPLINLMLNNREFVFGGRTEEAYSRNKFIPLTRTIPTRREDNSIQMFDVGGDIHVSLCVRTKNDFGNTVPERKKYNNSGSAKAKGDITCWQRHTAWNYAVVLETQVEPKLSPDYEFYREGPSFKFYINRPQTINSAYFTENTIKSYVPKPFRLRDDPNQGNVVAVSDPKMSGQRYDSWTQFKPNNFYAELEKNKGDISNLVKQDGNLYSIQKEQTSQLYIGVDRLIQDNQGNPINIRQGSGTVVEGHKIISPYGTHIRRSVVESDFGFVFFDPSKIEFVKIDQPLLLKNMLHLEYFNMFSQNPIIDSEAFFDYEKKESNVSIIPQSGSPIVISYNEMLKAFNGNVEEYSRDIYFNFNNNLYAPYRLPIGNSDPAEYWSPDIHQFNKGPYLNFFGNQKEMKIGFYLNVDSSIDSVIQYKSLNLITDLGYPVKNIFIKSNLGYDRNIAGTHQWYKIREGIHSVPAINDSMDFYNNSDVRGSWVYIEITLESKDNAKGNLLGVVNNYRLSHQ